MRGVSGFNLFIQADEIYMVNSYASFEFLGFFLVLFEHAYVSWKWKNDDFHFLFPSLGSGETGD